MRRGRGRKRFAVTLAALLAVAGGAFVDGQRPSVVQPVVAAPAIAPAAAPSMPPPSPAPAVERPPAAAAVDEGPSPVRIAAADRDRLAAELGIAEEHLPAWTAALYNGGAVNVKRMRAGLIGSLRETQKYMQAVPLRTSRLERVLG